MNDKVNNPFVFGKVVDGESFCNRKEELRVLQTHIRNNFSVWLYSPRRYGKTSLVLNAFSKMKGVKTIYFDLYNVQSTDDFSRKYSQALAEGLFDWKQDIKLLTKKISAFLSRLYPKLSYDSTGNLSLSFDAGNINSQSEIESILNLPESIAAKNKFKVCIALDEFQEIQRINPFLINWMRSAFQLQKHVCYVFLGSKQSLMKDIFASSRSPFYEFGIKMDLKPITREHLHEFIQHKFELTGIKIKKDIIDVILDKSGCHPHYTQLFAATVYDYLLEKNDPKSKQFNEQWMERIIGVQSVVFQGIWDQLSKHQRSVLLAIAKSEEGVGLFSSKMKEKNNLPVSSSLAIALKGLANKDLISKEGSLYVINNPVLKEWIISVF